MTFGLINVHKPVGPTSHEIVAAVRRGTGERRVGHGGTLDPLAEGVLLLALGPATRLLEYALGHEKTYQARIRLGIETATYDAEGDVITEIPLSSDLSEADVEIALEGFRGDIEQTPPVYSALKVDGKAAYERTRAGETVEMPVRRVVVHEIRITAFRPPEVELHIRCSSGTYIRSLAHDLGQILGCGAHLAGLKRVASGHFELADAVLWAKLVDAMAEGRWQAFLIPPDAVLSNYPAIHLDSGEAERVSNGLPVVGRRVAAGIGRAYDPEGRFLAVVKGDVPAGAWRPHKVFSGLYD